MTNTTDIYWEADGVSLHTFAHNIETLGGGRSAPPAFRGDDVTIPHAPGQKWVPKQPHSRVIPLAMWVRGYDDNGAPGDPQSWLFEENLSRLKKMLWRPGIQFPLRKRFHSGGVVRAATALAEYVSGFETLTMLGRSVGKMVINLKLADPYFYEDIQQSQSIVNGNQNISVLGDAPTQRIEITIAGARDNTTIKNNTLGMQVQYTAPLGVGAQTVIDVPNYEALTTPSGGPPFDGSGFLLHAGAPELLSLAPGTNQINLSSDSGAGVVTFKHRGAWL